MTGPATALLSFIGLRQNQIYFCILLSIKMKENLVTMVVDGKLKLRHRKAPCCEKVGLKKERWTAEEDEILTKYIQASAEGFWRSLTKNSGLLRCGKSCRLRWINYLRADLKRGNITTEEEETIVKLHSSLGNSFPRSRNNSTPPSDMNAVKIAGGEGCKRKRGRVSRSTAKKHKLILTSIGRVKSVPLAEALEPEAEENASTLVNSSSSIGQIDETSQDMNMEIGAPKLLGDSDIYDHSVVHDSCMESGLCPVWDRENESLGLYEWLDSEILIIYLTVRKQVGI